MNCCSAPRVIIRGLIVAKGNKWRVLTVPTPSKPGYLTSSAAPPRVAKELIRSPASVHMSLSRVNIGASVTDPPEHYARSVKVSMSTTTANGYAQSTLSARVESSEHLVRIMEVVSRMKGKTDTYQIEALIDLEN